MKKIIRTLYVLIAMAGAISPASAKKPTYDLTGRNSTGFNAFNHLLQKPLPNDEFPTDEQGFGKHMFIGAGVGTSLLGDAFSGLGKPGVNVSGQLGGWFTPLHGLRLNGMVGLMSVHDGVNRSWFGSFSAEYMLNLSALQAGYNPYRKFEVIGSVGAEVRMIRQAGRGEWGKNAGLTTALQVRYNAGPTLYLFAEPRLSVLAGYSYDNSDWRRFKTSMSFSLGLGYRILQGHYRTEGSQTFKSRDDDNIYFGIEGGIGGFPRHTGSLGSPFGAAYVGKQLTASSALQLKGEFGHLTHNGGHRYGDVAIGSLDYVLNLADACGGYRPDNVFDLLANVGISGGYVSDGAHGTAKSPGLSIGLTGLFRLSPNWSLTLHPQLYTFKNSFNEALGIGHSPLSTFTVGVRYTIGNYSQRFPYSYESFAKASDWFITAGGGFDHNFRFNFGEGFNGSVGFGKRFTPVSSWRLTLDGDIYPRDPMYITGTLHADYMSSITTAMLGYDPDRLVDMQLTLGVFAGIANYDTGTKAIAGVSAGLQAGFRLNSALDLYVEPQIRSAYGLSPKCDHRHWSEELRVNVGLRYKLGSPSQPRGDIADTPYGEKRNFLGFAVGPTTFLTSGFSRHNDIKAMLDISAGHWFSRVSAVRLTYGSDWLKFNRKVYYFGSVHADYMLNLTSWFDGNSSRRFHIIGAVGAGVGFSDCGRTSPGLMTYGGVQFRYNLPKNIDVHIEPGLSFWANRIIPYPLNDPTIRNRFALSGRLAAGISVRF